ncbi:MAG: ATP-binding protein [Flavobacteriales bacterium]|jgi:two-component system phosphate regulon sensor histidine kinase PhoR|nr:ATP-binding protein [Flavobacteriales bacterium]
MAQLSTRQVSFIAAAVVASAAALLAWTPPSIVGPAFARWWPLLVGIVLLLLAYNVFFLGVERFVHERVKALYRTVHDIKRSKPAGQDEGTRSNELDRAGDEVMAWATERRAEIHELHEREKFRREFIGNLAHELKTPIFNIQGYILTLLEGGLEDEKVNRDFLTRASNGVDRLMKIVEDLDMITKLESGVMELRLARVDLHELTQEIMDALELKAQERRMRLVNGIEPGTVAMADRSRMAQVLTNLVNNAINYGREGGRCTCSSYAFGDQVVVEVSDDGIGISPEHLPRLFERFYRVGKSRARNEGGSGLGLAIVKHIIDAHGQTIAVKSQEGKGTTFVLTLQRPA